MHLVTTTRFHLLAAFVAACTLTPQGFAIAGLLVVLELLRVLARHHLDRTTLSPAHATPPNAAANQAAAIRSTLAS